MTNRSDFISYYLRAIWRDGDQDLMTDMPRLIKEAEARISRDFRDAAIAMIATVVLDPEENSAPLPPDFKELVSIDFPSGRIARAVPYDVLASVLSKGYGYIDAAVVYYSIHNGSIHLAKWDIAPVDIVISYRAAIQPFPEEAGAVSFYDKHPDFFISALNVQTYSYLRDFELSNEYNSKYVALLEDMRRESNYILFPSGQLPSPMPDTAHSGRYKPVTAGVRPPTVVDGTPYDFVSIYNQAKR